MVFLRIICQETVRARRIPSKTNRKGNWRDKMARKSAEEKELQDITSIDTDHIDPIIEGLLIRLPAPGSNWPEAARKMWLSLLENSFGLIYKDAPPTP